MQYAVLHNGVKMSKPTKQPAYVTKTFRLPKDLVEAFEAEGAHQERNLTYLVRKALEEYAKRFKKRGD